MKQQKNKSKKSSRGTVYYGRNGMPLNEPCCESNFASVSISWKTNQLLKQVS